MGKGGRLGRYTTPEIVRIAFILRRPCTISRDITLEKSIYLPSD